MRIYNFYKSSMPSHKFQVKSKVQNASTKRHVSTTKHKENRFLFKACMEVYICL